MHAEAAAEFVVSMVAWTTHADLGPSMVMDVLLLHFTALKRSTGHAKLFRGLTAPTW